MIFSSYGSKPFGKSFHLYTYYLMVSCKPTLLVRGSEIIVLLIGGDKSTQSKDIEKAKEMAKEYQDE